MWYGEFMRTLRTDRMYCFSPPVMIATFVIEICLAVYALWRYKLNAVTRPAVAVLVFLAIFQLAEYNVCEGSFGIDSLGWSRIGYIAITMLPPFGIHLAARLAGKKSTSLLVLAYVTGILFAAFFAFSGQGITASACMGNYVIFKTAPGSTLFYTLYYYGWLMVTVAYSFVLASRSKQASQARALRALAVGYLVFIVPTTAVNIVSPSTIAGIPSIMCGFAVLLAIILAGEVLPQYFKQSHSGARKRTAHG